MNTLLVTMERLSKFTDLGFLLVRIIFGFRLIYGTMDNLIDYDRMLEFRGFLELHGFPFPLVAAFVSVVVQFAAGIGWILGVWVRWFSVLILLNFTIALLMVHFRDTYLQMAPAIHLMAVSFLLLVHGGGKYTLVRSRKDPI